MPRGIERAFVTEVAHPGRRSRNLWVWGAFPTLLAAVLAFLLLDGGRSADVAISLLAGGLLLALLVRQNRLVRELKTSVAARDELTQNLRRSEARWSSVVDNSSDMIALLDEGAVLKWTSRVVTQMLGWEREDFEDLDAFDIIHPDDYDIAAEGLAEALMRMEPRSIEVRLRHKNGTWRWLEIRATNLLDDPDVASVVIAGRDVTDRRQAEDALRSSEERFRELTETVKEVFFIHSPDQGLLYISPAYEKVWGQPRKTLYENPDSWLDSIVPEDRIEVHKSLLESGTKERFVRYRIVRADGELRWIEGRSFPIVDRSGQIVRVVGTAEDVTERKLVEEALVAREEFERSILDSLGAQIAVLDGDGQIIAVNEAWERFALENGGDPDRTGIGMSYLKVLRASLEHEPDYESAMALEGLEAVLAGRRERFFIEYECASDEQKRWFTMHVSPLRGALGGAVVSHLDITERMTALQEQERLTEQLRQSQKLEAIGRLAGGIAHDFNNVLAVIQNYAWFLTEDMDPDDPKLQDVKEILSAGERAGKLVQQLLTFSRKEIVKPEVLDLNAVISEYGTFLRRAIGEDVRLEVALTPDLPSVLLDSGHLGQILTNLAVNARDAMPSGGRLTIETAAVYIDEEDQSGVDMDPGDYVALKVTDTGCGMSNDVLNHIFEPFFTTKARGQGTGLGLATVYGIVNQSRGQIVVNSKVGVGTSFTIYLPVVRSRTEERELAPAPAAIPEGREQVLLVEDEAGVRRMVARILTDRGYAVLKAASGEEALRIAREHVGKIDLLLTDVVMPQMSGKELADRMAKLRPETATVFMSGYTDEIIARQGRVGEGEVLIDKPFTPDELLMTIRAVLESRVSVNS